MKIPTPVKTLAFGLFLIILIMQPTSAANVQDLNVSCYNDTHTEIDADTVTNLQIRNDCVGGNYIDWGGQEINLSFGALQDGELAIGEEFMFLDSSLRPDFDYPATLVFERPVTVIEPSVYNDGVLCGDCNVTHSMRKTEIEVTGFSNYSVQKQKDFTVYDDGEPELKGKVYQVVDLGDANRGTEFACTVQVFGRNQDGDWVLVQTNPERKAVGNVLGDPDTNQPESLGYFPTKNGVANTYFRAGFFDNIKGYSDFNLVIQCTDSGQKLVWEESISTRYSPAGRTVTARGVWFTAGNNAMYVMFYAVVGIFLLWFGGMVWRSITER